MFENLSDKLNTVFKQLKGHGKLTEKNIQDGLREVRMALLEADVHYKVAKKLIADIMAMMSPGDDPFPASLSSEQQALFALGYYHQRSEFFKSKKIEQLEGAAQ